MNEGFKKNEERLEQPEDGITFDKKDLDDLDKLFDEMLDEETASQAKQKEIGEKQVEEEMKKELEKLENKSKIKKEAKVEKEMQKELERLEKKSQAKKEKEKSLTEHLTPEEQKDLPLAKKEKQEILTPEEKEDSKMPEEMEEEKSKLDIENSAEIDKMIEIADQESKELKAEIEKRDPWIRKAWEKTWGKTKEGGNWYKKVPLQYKVLFSFGLIGAASVSAFVGGAVGTAIATAAFTGKLSQRTLGGVALFISAEDALRKKAEKGGRKRGRWEARRHTAEAAILGILIGIGPSNLSKAMDKIAEATGLTEKEIANSVEKLTSGISIEGTSEEAKNTILLSEEKLSSNEDLLKSTKEMLNEKHIIPKVTPPVVEAPVAPEMPATAEAPVAPAFQEHLEYQGGRSIWQEAEKQLSARFGDHFEKLGEVGSDKAGEALKTYNIDRVKDTIVDALDKNDTGLIEKYNLSGIKDVNKLTAEQLRGIKWDKVFEDTFTEKELTADLSEKQISGIIESNEAQKNALKAPTETITPEDRNELTEIIEEEEKKRILQKAGVSEKDIEALQKDDIKNLTPEQIEKIGIDTKKGLLKKLGISLEDIKNLEKSDLRDLTLPQIESIGIETKMNEEIGKLYGSKGIFGFGASNGIDSNNWQYIKDKSALEIFNKNNFGMFWDNAYNDTEKDMHNYLQKISRESGLKPVAGEKIESFMKKYAEKLVRRAVI